MIREVAAALRVNRKTIAGMIDRGELAAVRVGRQWHIPASAITAPAAYGDAERALQVRPVLRGQPGRGQPPPATRRRRHRRRGPAR
jgi:excisionase family DNA binding protein